MVYQEPAAPQPVDQGRPPVAEVFEIAGVHKSEALERAEESLRTVQISDPAACCAPTRTAVRGMLQRVVIAMALARSRPARPRRADDSVDAPSRRRCSTSCDVARTIPDVVVVHQPQPRRHRQDVRPRRVMYAGRSSNRGRPRRSSTILATRTRSAAALRAAAGHRKDHGRLDTIPGFLPAPGRSPWAAIFANRWRSPRPLRHETPPMYEVSATRARAATTTRRRRSCRGDAGGRDVADLDETAAPIIRSGRVEDLRGPRERVQAVVGVTSTCVSVRLWVS